MYVYVFVYVCTKKQHMLSEAAWKIRHIRPFLEGFSAPMAVVCVCVFWLTAPCFEWFKREISRMPPHFDA